MNHHARSLSVLAIALLSLAVPALAQDTKPAGPPDPATPKSAAPPKTAPKPALTENQVLVKITPVPVFLLIGEKGEPLVATTDGQAVIGVFITPDDAKNFLSNFAKKQPDMAKKVKVSPVSLAEIYTGAEKQKDAKFAFVPSAVQVTEATKIRKAAGQPFQGTPLFIGKAGTNYVTIQQNGKTIIPAFFSKAELDVLIAKFKETQPDKAQELTVEVATLESLLVLLRTSGRAEIGMVEMVPTREALQYVENESKQATKDAAKPDVKPAPAAKP